MRLNQVTVGSTDLDRAERFYRLLGLRLIVKTDDYLRFECPDGDSTFSVERVSEAAAGEQVTVYFEADDLDDQYQRLRGSVEFTQPPTDMPWLWREARLHDPDGHRLCLFHAGQARRNPPWRLPPGGSARLDEGEAKLGPPQEHGGSARLDEGEAKQGPPHEHGGSARLDEGEAMQGPPHEHGGAARLDEGEAKLEPPQEAQDLP